MLGFNLCLKQIDVSIAYAVWSALGTVIVTLAGVTMFGEKISVVKVLCLSLIVAGVVGLNVLEG
jgi:small multidrug resistance pump